MDMKKKIATLLRKWANRLAPGPMDINFSEWLPPLAYEEYKINRILFRITINPVREDWLCCKEYIAREIASEMLKLDVITFQDTPISDSKLEITATAYVGIKK